MKRNDRLKMGLYESLIVQLDEENKLFWQERPWLQDSSLKPELVSFSVKRDELEKKKTAILKELEKIS